MPSAAAMSNTFSQCSAHAGSSFPGAVFVFRPTGSWMRTIRSPLAAPHFSSVASCATFHPVGFRPSRNRCSPSCRNQNSPFTSRRDRSTCDVGSPAPAIVETQTPARATPRMQQNPRLMSLILPGTDVPGHPDVSGCAAWSGAIVRSATLEATRGGAIMDGGARGT